MAEEGMAPDPVLLKIGPITVYWYGVLIVCGAMLAAQITSQLSRRNGHNPEIAWNMLLILLLAGILGARLPHPLELGLLPAAPQRDVRPADERLWHLWRGDLWPHSAGYLLLRESSASSSGLDYIAPGLSLAQAIGRWGNYFNSELYGDCTTLPCLYPARQPAGVAGRL